MLNHQIQETCKYILDIIVHFTIFLRLLEFEEWGALDTSVSYVDGVLP